MSVSTTTHTDDIEAREVGGKWIVASENSNAILLYADTEREAKDAAEDLRRALHTIIGAK